MEQLLHRITRVTQTRYLMLSAQLATQLQPIIEKSLTCLNDFQMLQSNILIAFSLVIAIDFL